MNEPFPVVSTHHCIDGVWKTGCWLESICMHVTDWLLSRSRWMQGAIVWVRNLQLWKGDEGKKQSESPAATRTYHFLFSCCTGQKFPRQVEFRQHSGETFTCWGTGVDWRPADVSATATYLRHLSSSIFLCVPDLCSDFPQKKIHDPYCTIRWICKKPRNN